MALKASQLPQVFCMIYFYLSMWMLAHIKGIILAKSAQKLYLPICLVDDGFDAFKHLWFNKGHKSVPVVFWVKASSGSCGVDKMGVCLCLYLKTINIKQLFVHISGNKQSIYGNGLTMLGSLIMWTIYTNKFTFGHLKLRFRPPSVLCNTFIFFLVMFFM